MAKNPIIEAQISFAGGQTNDEFAGPGNNFWNSKNVDVRRNTREITLSGRPINNDYAVGGVPRAIYGATKATQLTFCYNGYISSAANATLRTHSSSNTGSKKYCNVVPYGEISSRQGLLILSEKYIHTVAYNSSSLPGTVVEENWTFANQDSNKPYLIFNGDLLIADGNYIQKIVWTGTTYVPASGVLTSTTAILGIDSTETILAIFELGDQVVFFTNEAQYFWDGYNEAYDRRVPRDAIIVAATQFKTAFHVVTKDDVLITLWETSNGYDRVEVQKEEIYGTGEKRLDMTYAYSNSMMNMDGITYFGGGGDGELNSYGYFNPGMNKVLQKHITGQGNITCIFTGGSLGLLYYGWYDGTTYYVGTLEQRLNITNKYTAKDGLIELNPEIGDSFSMDKAMEKYRVGYKLDSALCFIPVYARVDGEEDMFTFYKATYTILPTVGTTYGHNSSTYTVVRTKTSTTGKLWLHCQRTSGATSPTTTGTLSRIAGTGDVSIAFSYYVNYGIVGLIDGSDSDHLSEYKYPLVYGERFNKMQFALGLIGTTAYTPRIYDFIWEFNQINNDL